MKTNQLMAGILCLCVIMLLQGCASIVSRSKYPVTINSTPDNATLTITDGRGRDVFKGQTPANVKLASSHGFFEKAEYTLTFSAPGCPDKTTHLYATINGWYFGNIFLGGIIGMLIVDPATGAMWRIQEKTIHESLTETQTSAELRIVDIKDVPDEFKESLKRLN